MSDIRRTLRGVANDLWGAPVQKAAPATPETDKTDKTINQAAPAEPAFEEIWKAVDDAIDWTALLADGGEASPLAPLAGRVLAGETAAYEAALQALQPLSDLSGYCTDCAVTVVDADTLQAAYRAAFSADNRRLACGLALRIARDLLAALPVFTVQVHATYEGGAVLDAAYTRDALRGIRVNVVDPEAVTAACGTWTNAMQGE